MSAWAVCKKVLLDTSTGVDGKTYCATRCWGHVIRVCYLALSAYNVYLTHTFDHIAFAGGFAAIETSVAGAIWVKRSTEPQGPPQ